MNTYVIIQTGGKQYRVQEGDTLKVEKIEAKTGDEVQLDQVLFAKNDGKVISGKPMVTGALVTAQVMRQVRAPKLLVFRQHQKKVFKKTHGHRQTLTELRIKQIKLPKI